MCCFGRVDEGNARAELPTGNIPIEGKITSRQIWATPRNQDKM